MKNLTRGVGEAANFVVLSTKDKAKFAEWVRSSKQERLKNFKPANVQDSGGWTPRSGPILRVDPRHHPGTLGFLDHPSLISASYSPRQGEWVTRT
jgi:hypothetical protein